MSSSCSGVCPWITTAVAGRRGGGPSVRPVRHVLIQHAFARRQQQQAVAAGCPSRFTSSVPVMDAMALWRT
eukprot:11699132-Alexandrium_andersonii.AAC.1